MNKVTITKTPDQEFEKPEWGALYESTALNDVVGPGRIYIAAYRGGEGNAGRLTLFSLASGGRHNDGSTWGPSGPAGWRRLPRGTVVTITVEG